MFWHIMYAHEKHKKPDVIIRQDGKVERATPSILPHAIAIDAPGLKPLRYQLVELHKLLNRDDSLELEFSCDAKPLQEVFWAMRIVERGENY